MEGALRILEQKPYKVHDNKFLNNIYKNIQSNKGATPRQKVRAVHFTDAHVDKLYTIGTKKECPGPQSCCRVEFGFPEDIRDGAN